MTLPLFAIDAGVGVLGGIAISLASIGLVFLIHELGHLLAAKACGMKISRYYLGFDAATDPRSFAAKAVWQRIVVIAAGSLMNLVFAAAVAAAAYRLGVSYMPCILGGTVAGDPPGNWAFVRETRSCKSAVPVSRMSICGLTKI